MPKILNKPDEKEETENIVLYIKKNKHASYPTKYGLEFQCVELIRRFFSIHKGLTFPDVVDASELFTFYAISLSVKDF